MVLPDNSNLHSLIFNMMMNTKGPIFYFIIEISKIFVVHRLLYRECNVQYAFNYADKQWMLFIYDLNGSRIFTYLH